jgi:HPt (histidine-containing phosphotransfer) domain-containing protein
MCIQEKTLKKIRQLGGEALLAQLITLFLEQGKARLASIRSSLAEGDFEVTARQAHSLVSSSGNLGADIAMNDARALEAAAEARDAAAATAAFSHLEGSLSQAMARLAEIRAHLPSGG